MTNRKAQTILRAMLAMKRGALKGVDRFRWCKEQKDLARKVISEDIEALRKAIEVLA